MAELKTKISRVDVILANMKAFTKTETIGSLILQTSMLHDPRFSEKNIGVMFAKLSAADSSDLLANHEEELKEAKKNVETDGKKLDSQPSYNTWIHVRPSKANEEYYYQIFNFG